MKDIDFSLAVNLSTRTREEFEQNAAPYSIALDGAVAAATFRNISKRIFNFNHHHGVDRSATKATCEQVFEAIKTGLYRDLFHVNGVPTSIAVVNDSDQDVSLSVALLANPDLVDSYLISRLVSVEGRLDAYGGGYPFPKNMDFLGVVGWIYEAYSEFSLSDDILTASAQQHEAVIWETEKRILAYAQGKEKKIPIDTRYEILGEVGEYKIVKKMGAMATLGMAQDGIGGYVEIKDLGSTRKVSVSSQSPFKESGNLIDLAERFNRLEKEAGGYEGWGGGDKFCCSPRGPIHTLLSTEVILAELAA